MPVVAGNVKHQGGFCVALSPLCRHPDHPVAALSELFTMLSHAAGMG